MCILRDVSGVALTEEVLISNNTALVEYNTAVFMRTEHARASRSQARDLIPLQTLLVIVSQWSQ